MPFQEVATEMAWGKVWTRPGLDLASRSLVTLAMCIALNRPNEIKIHLRGALRNGVTLLQIRELLLHSFMYCGGPAALDACATVRAGVARSAPYFSNATMRPFLRPTACLNAASTTLP